MVPIAPPRVDSSKGPNRVNRAHWPTKGNRQILYIFACLRSMEKMAWDAPKWGQEDFFPTNPDLADVLGRTDMNFEKFYVFDLLDPKFLDFQVFRSPNSQISRSPDLQIPTFPGSQISRFPDFQTPPPDEFSHPNLTPLPTHPGIKYVARAFAAIMYDNLKFITLARHSVMTVCLAAP